VAGYALDLSGSEQGSLASSWVIMPWRLVKSYRLLRGACYYNIIIPFII